MIIRKFLALTFLFLSSFLFSQEEGLKPLNSNLNYFYQDLKPAKVAVKPNDVSHQKTAASTISLPFIEDFSYAPSSAYPDQNKWSDSLVYVNVGYPTAAPSIGVATFDGLNKHGFPYTPYQTNMTLSSKADTLTSQAINLFTSGTQTLDPFSDIAISFYYQARGKGDSPEQADSLVLDFFRPYARPDTAWKRVWFSRGNSNSNINDSVFKRGFVRIKDTAYFHEGFKFRFRNWASTAGNFDHWHLDYIVLDKGRADSLVDTVRNDIAFANVPSSFLRDYSAMPYEQFVPGEMAPRLGVRIRNNSGSQVNMAYKYSLFDKTGSPVFNEYNGGFANLNPFIKNNYPIPPDGPGYGYATTPAHATPSVSFSFPLLTDSADYKIKHYIYLTGSTTSDFFPENDTVIQYQRFRNYYAFDDGSSEAGYYVNAPGGKLAMKINLNVEDTLRAVRIYFDPVGSVKIISGPSSDYNFNLQVWAQSPSGAPGDLIIDDNIDWKPKYTDSAGFKGVPEFRFGRDYYVLPPGTYFVGIRQHSKILTVGFDMNNDHSTSTYFDSGNGWTQSSFKGSVMIRPVFGKFVPTPVGIEELSSSAKNSFLVYPNPASSQFTILSSDLKNKSYQLFNSMGQVVKEDNFANNELEVSTSELSSGIYILILKTQGQVVQQQKLIIQH